MRSVQRWLLSLLLVANMLLSSFAFAECATCTKSPTELDKYFRVMEELIKLIDTSQDPASGIEAMTVAASTSLSLARDTTILATILSFQTVGNMFSSLKIGHKSESLRRDWDKLTDIDLKIAKRVLDMSQAQRHNDVIPVSVLTQIDTALQKLGYLKLAKDDSGKYFMETNQATYSELADLLWKLNRFYKIMHQHEWFDSTLDQVGMWFWATDDIEKELALEKPDNEALVNFVNQLYNLRGQVFTFCRRVVSEEDLDECSPVTVLDFAPSGKAKDMRELIVHVWSIQDDYDCSTGLTNECNEWSKVKEKSKELFSNRLVTDVNKSIDTFVEAWWNLMWALYGPDSKNGEAAQQRKDALLTNYWWPSRSKDGEESRFLTNVKIEEAPQDVKWLWKSLDNVFQKQDSDLVSKTQDKQTFNEWLSGRTVGKFWFVNGKSAQQPNTNDRPDQQGDNLKYQDKEAKEAKVDEILWDALENEKYKWLPGVLDSRNRSQADILDVKIASFQNTFQQVLSLQNEMQVEAVYSDVNRVTHQFPALSAAVYQSMELIGKKNSEWKLYHAMGNVCDLQCTNLGTKCRYHVE